MIALNDIGGAGARGTVRSKLFCDFEILILDAQAPADLDQIFAGVRFSALNPDERGTLENLIADKRAVLARRGNCLATD